MEELKALINSLLAEVQRLKDRVQELETENAELKIRFAQNSANSHKPPSSEGLAKKPLIKPALPKEVGKQPGGQPGHPGKTLLFVEQPDLIHTHQATQCQHCGLPLQGSGQMVARRQVFDLPQPRLFVEEPHGRPRSGARSPMRLWLCSNRPVPRRGSCPCAVWPPHSSTKCPVERGLPRSLCQSPPVLG